jgi:hypothetical protein
MEEREYLHEEEETHWWYAYAYVVLLLPVFFPGLLPFWMRDGTDTTWDG